MPVMLAFSFYPHTIHAMPEVQEKAHGAGTGDPAQTGGTLHLGELRRELLKSNPELQAARKRLEAALTRPAQESALPDPRFTGGWVSSGWPYPGAGLRSEPMANIGIQVAQEIPFPGKRALKGGVAMKQAETEARLTRALQLGLIAQLEEKFYDLRFVYEAQDIIREQQALLQQLAKAAEARYAVGKGMQQDIIRANTEIAILEHRVISFEQKKLSLSAQLNTLVDRMPDADLGRPEPASPMPGLGPFEMFQKRLLEASPVLGAQRAVIDGRQLNLQSAQKAYYPDFDVMAGYYNQGILRPMWEFKIQVNIPLYFWKKQRYGLEEAGAVLAEAQRNYRAQVEALGSRLRERHAAAQTAQKLMDLYARQIVPQSELALESSLASYETGGVDFLSVLSNLTMILDYRMNYREQAAEYWKALSGLEELAGSLMEGPDAARQAPGGEVRQ